MKEKIMNIKNILKIIISIFIIFSMIKSCSKASMTKSEAFEYCKENCGYESMFNSSGAEYPQYNLIGYNNYLNYLDSDTHNVFFVKRQNNLDYFDIFFYDTLQVNGNTYTVTLNKNFYSTTKRTSSFNNLYDTHGGTQNKGTNTLALPTGRQ